MRERRYLPLSVLTTRQHQQNVDLVNQYKDQQLRLLAIMILQDGPVLLAAASSSSSTTATSLKPVKKSSSIAICAVIVSSDEGDEEEDAPATEPSKAPDAESSAVPDAEATTDHTVGSTEPEPSVSSTQDAEETSMSASPSPFFILISSSFLLLQLL
ncbi:hypothetical protein Aperf_G00000115009 [Anoplocephala perfoliata]